MTKKVVYAKFHQAIHSRKLGELGSSLPGTNKSFKELSMTLEKEGLLVHAATMHGKSKILVPYPNISSMDLAEEQE